MTYLSIYKMSSIGKELRCLCLSIHFPTSRPLPASPASAASNVDYAALMGVFDNHMSCIKAVCPKEYDTVMSQIHALR